MDVQLKVVQGKQKGQLLQFHSGDVLIGRGPECQVRPDSPLVSRQHCLMRVESSSVWLRDLGSAHGTLVNDALVTSERLLQNGDQVQLGPVVLEVILPEDDSKQTDDQMLRRTDEMKLAETLPTEKHISSDRTRNR